jgi:hypothetical protein
MHSVADLVPQKAKRSTSVPTNCLRAQRGTANEFSAAAPMPTNGMADGLDPAKIFRRSFLSSIKSVPGPGLLAKSARYWIVGPARGRLQLVGGVSPGSSWSLLLNLPLVRNPSARWRWRNPLVDTELTDIGGIAMLPLKVSGP